MADPRTVPRVLALVAVATLFASPVRERHQRRIESRADVDALEATGDPAAFVELQGELALKVAGRSHAVHLVAVLRSAADPTTLQRIALADAVRPADPENARHPQGSGGLLPGVKRMVSSTPSPVQTDRRT